MHIDVGNLSGYLAYLRGEWKDGVSPAQAKRWMEIQSHLKSCEVCQKHAQALRQVDRMEKRVIERLTPKSKWDQLVMKMADSSCVFEIRMKNMFESAEISLREAGVGNQWKPIAVRGESSEWQGRFQEDEMRMGAAAGGIYVEGKPSVQVFVFERNKDGLAGNLVYEGQADGLEEIDFQAGDYLVIVKE
ncbi:hypothetical protein SANA_30320 [Gottschalkiaceae bacterium SANA]|nr:hypothetical protein SANA_30320 [Gottschalkiaceae bacterium SANA]